MRGLAAMGAPLLVAFIPLACAGQDSVRMGGHRADQDKAPTAGWPWTGRESGGMAGWQAAGQGTPWTAGWQWAGSPTPYLQEVESDANPGVVALLSLTLPGAGQHVLDQRRKWVYLAFEVAGWAFFLESRGAGRDLRDQYRTLAWAQARIQAGPRVDGDFDYYETLGKWTRSGVFDTDGGATGLQPEMDQTTFNGSIWALAEQIFLAGGASVPSNDPAYVAAVDYYRARAYGESFLWDWTGSPGAQQEFNELISDSDERFRQATTAIGLVIANHLISAADAYLAARGVQPPLRIVLAPSSTFEQAGWQALIQLPLTP